MAKTFNPNRVGGGGVSIVRAADGTYSLKETGFDQISSLNMVDLGAIATTTTAAKTETAADKTGTTVEDQTKQAFLLPKQDKGDDPFTTEKMLKSATDVSKGLSEVETVSDRQKTESQLGARRTFDADTFDDTVGTRIKDPTESVFGRTPLEDDFKTMVEPKVETPQEKVQKEYVITSKKIGEQVQKFKDFTDRVVDSMKGSRYDVNINRNPNLDAIAKQSSEVAQAGSGKRDINVAPNIFDITEKGDPALNVGSRNVTGEDPYRARTLGVSADPSRFAGVSKMGALAGEGEKDNFVSIPAKTTFRQSVSTALKGVGEAVSKLPTVQFLASFGAPRNESVSTRAFNKSRFNIVTSSGPMQGRIVGTKEDPNLYDPQNNLFHGMNRTSALGNLEKAGQKRIDKIKENLAKGIYRNPEAQQAKVDKFERELDDYRRDKNDHNIKDYSKKKNAQDIKNLNPNEMRNVAETGNESGNTGGKSIVCTAMYQTTGLQDWSKAMKIWYIYQKKYLTIQHQEGYHKLFKPFVKGMHKSNIIKAIGAHFAKHRTQHLKHIMFNSKPSLLGKIYNKILEPICYWAGKK
jgi:hypothetical protein